MIVGNLIEGSTRIQSVDDDDVEMSVYKMNDLSLFAVRTANDECILHQYWICHGFECVWGTKSQIPFGEFDDVETIVSVQKLIWLNQIIWMIMLIFNGWFLEAN